MEIYNKEFRKKLSNKIIVNTIAIAIVDFLLLLGILLPIILFKREHRVIFEIICIVSALLLLYIDFIFYFIKYRALLDLKKRIKINDNRKKSVTTGYFRLLLEKPLTIDGVHCNIYEFDVGQKYLDKAVNRQLYIEESISNPFIIDKCYELVLVDNYILEYKEVIDNE